VFERGVYPVLTTPYGSSGEIDLIALRREIDFVFDVGAHGVTCALVSDVLRLTTKERLSIPSRLVEAADGRGPVIMSVGAESVVQARLFAEAAETSGVGAVMAIAPVSQSLDEVALERYFVEIAENVSVPVIIQDASGYLGRPMSTQFQAALWHRFGDRLWFKPEAEPLGQRQSALLDATDGQAAIFEGSGGIALVDAYRRGIHGTMPACDLLDGIVALWHALEAGDEERIYALYFPICAIAAIQLQGGLDGFIAIERYLLTQRGVLPPQLPREPFTYHLDDQTRSEIDRLFARMQSALG
jgi:4-hydroxy-tetrahydrodipicolinate synthase